VFGASDLPALVADMGVAVSIGTSSTTGLFNQDQVQRIATETGVVENITQTSVLIVTGSLSGLAQDAVIVVDGATYAVRNWSPRDDGQLTEIVLAQ
jgi:hypothetical protein